MLHDVTQPIYSGMPRASTLPQVCVDPLLRLIDGAALETSLLRLPSHAGTHIDAPAHAVPGGTTIDQVPIGRFTGPAVVLTVRRGPGELITADDLAAGGPVPRRGDMVLLDTGAASRWGDDDYFDHASLDEGASAWLLDQGVSLLGVDAVTPDLAIPRRPDGFDFPVHHALLGNDVLIAENLGDLTGLAGRRVRVHAFPLTVRGGDAGHVRFVVDDAI